MIQRSRTWQNIVGLPLVGGVHLIVAQLTPLDPDHGDYIAQASSNAVLAVAIFWLWT